MKQFLKICKMHKQSELKKYLCSFMKGSGYEVVNADGYLFCKPKANSDKICLTAHMDVVHPTAVRQIVVEHHENQTIISSPQGIGGDDRCGVWMIMECVKKGYRPYVLFCEDEEIGCIGAEKFTLSKDIATLADCKFIVQLDRRNATDAVYYECDNPDFEKFITKVTGYITEWGTCSDISVIAPALGVAAVNLSCGYYKEHTPEHYVIWEEMQNTLSATEELIKAARKEDVEQFIYMSRRSSYNWYEYGYGDYDEYEIQWISQNKFETTYVGAMSYEEAVGQFLMDHPTLTYGELLSVCGISTGFMKRGGEK